MQRAGAIAALVTDEDEHEDYLMIHMIDDGTDRNPFIPAAFIVGKNG